MTGARSIALRATGALGLALLLWVAIGMLGAQRACAHDPRFACSPRDAAHPVRIADPQKSWAFYGRLAPGQRDTYAFAITGPLHVPWNLLIERSDAGKPERPTAQIFDVAGKEVAVRSITGRPEAFHEPFSGLDYLASSDAPLSLQAGSYSVAISMSGEKPAAPQRYVFAIGQDERFTLGEIPYVLGAVVRVRTRGY